MTISNLFSIDEGDKVFDAQTAGHIRGARCPNEGRVHLHPIRGLLPTPA